MEVAPKLHATENFAFSFLHRIRRQTTIVQEFCTQRPLHSNQKLTTSILTSVKFYADAADAPVSVVLNLPRTRSIHQQRNLQERKIFRHCRKASTQGIHRRLNVLNNTCSLVYPFLVTSYVLSSKNVLRQIDGISNRRQGRQLALKRCMCVTIADFIVGSKTSIPEPHDTKKKTTRGRFESETKKKSSRKQNCA